MRSRIQLLILLLLPLAGALRAQNVETQYLRLQEGYTQRLQEIEQRHSERQRELLNKFILALVRVEQSYRDEGVLEGVIFSQELRNSLLTQPVFPEISPEAPEAFRNMLETLHRHRVDIQRESQTELDQLNRVLRDALEPYQAEFTRQGMIPRAVEVRDLRRVLSEALGDNPPGAPGVPASPPVSLNPGAFPFCLEPRGYAEIRGVIPREAGVDLRPERVGSVRTPPRGFLFEGGHLLFDAANLRALTQQVQTNQMLTLEFAFLTPHESQGNVNQPALIFLFGSQLADANLAITQEENQLVLYLRTLNLPAGRENHRVELGVVSPGRPQHVQTVYRSGELLVYFNGSAVNRIRGNVSGLLNNWQEASGRMGRLEPTTGMPDPPAWTGELFHLYVRGTLDSERTVISNYNRFLQTRRE